MNPNDVPEVCECGHEEGDHFIRDILVSDNLGDSWEQELTTCMGAKDCNCGEFRPRDDYYYAQQADDAATARWEEDHGR